MENVVQSAKIVTNVQTFRTFVTILALSCNNILHFCFLIVVPSATQHQTFLTSFMLQNDMSVKKKRCVSSLEKKQAIFSRLEKAVNLTSVLI